MHNEDLEQEAFTYTRRVKKQTNCKKNLTMVNVYETLVIAPVKKLLLKRNKHVEIRNQARKLREPHVVKGAQRCVSQSNGSFLEENRLATTYKAK